MARLGAPLLVSLVVVAAAGVVLCAERTPRAFGTTFGAPAKPINKTKPQPEPSPGRECHKNSNCPSGSNTTCRPDLEGHMRCLCIDRRPPQNGACHPMWKGLHWVCSKDEECMPRSECVVPVNATNTNNTNANSSSASNSNMTRVCLCKPGYTESSDGYECNGGELVTDVLSLVALMAVCVAAIL